MSGIDWHSIITKQFLPNLGAEETGKTLVSNSETQPVITTQQPKEVITPDMSELDVKAAMNKALGFSKSGDSEEIHMAKMDAAFSKNPVAFAKKYGAQVRDNAVDFAGRFDYEILQNYGDNQLAQLGPKEFVKANLGANPKDVARNFANTGILQTLNEMTV